MSPAGQDQFSVSPVAIGSLGHSAIASVTDGFDLPCAGLDSVRCGLVVRGSSPEEVVALARVHGARAHGFTPAWYGPRRLAAMMAAVTSNGAVR